VDTTRGRQWWQNVKNTGGQIAWAGTGNVRPGEFLVKILHLELVTPLLKAIINPESSQASHAVKLPRATGLQLPSLL